MQTLAVFKSVLCVKAFSEQKFPCPCGKASSFLLTSFCVYKLLRAKACCAQRFYVLNLPCGKHRGSLLWYQDPCLEHVLAGEG